MKKKIRSMVIATAVVVLVNIPAYAMGTWQKNDTGWWWQYTDERYPTNCWKWIDGNADGLVECYYFDGNGYMLENTTTPDNFTVNENGAWTVDGVVQQRTYIADLGHEIKAGVENVIPNSPDGTQPVMDGYSVEKIVPNMTLHDKISNQNTFPDFEKPVYKRDFAGMPQYSVIYKGSELLIGLFEKWNSPNHYIGTLNQFFDNIPAQGIELNAFYDNVGYESKSCGRDPQGSTGISDLIFELPTGSYRMAKVDIGKRHMEILLTPGTDGKYYIYPENKTFMN